MYTQTLSLKQLLVHTNGCRIKALLSHLGEEGSQAGSSEAGPAMCPDTSQLCSGWPDAEGGTAGRATAGTNSPGTCSVPSTAPTRHSFPQLPSRSLVEGSRTCSSPGIAAPATSKLRVTQPPPPPPPSHSSPFLKHCLSSITFTSHLPYHTLHLLRPFVTT